MDRHIVAIGGGGFGRSTRNLEIEKYIIKLSSKLKPKVCFIPTASGDNDSYKVNFYDVFTTLGCEPSHIDLFKRTIDIEDHIKKQDIIYVGGGNTKSLIALWKDWGLDLILKVAYHNGLILSGVSAGAICWFKYGITDSWQNNLSVLKCLNFVGGVCCPHYDEEENRIPYVKEIIRNRTIESCIAIEGDAALHFINDKPYRSINFGKDKRSYNLSLKESNILTTPYKSLSI